MFEERHNGALILDVPADVKGGLVVTDVEVGSKALDAGIRSAAP